MELTDRQIQILKHVIEEYITTAAPVGSEVLDRKFNLGVSPATIRNEMVQLTRSGYLKQPHTSAGRSPTPKAFKLYISQLMQEEDLSVAEEVSVKEKMWDFRDDLDDLLRQATRTLADKTKCIGLAVTSDNKIYHSGYFYVLDKPEFYDIDVTKTVFSLLDQVDELFHIFEHASGDDPIHVLLGDDFQNKFLEPVGIVFADFNVSGVQGSIGVVGPARLPFYYVIPLIRHLSLTLQEIARG